MRQHKQHLTYNRSLLVGWVSEATQTTLTYNRSLLVGWDSEAAQTTFSI